MGESSTALFQPTLAALQQCRAVYKEDSDVVKRIDKCIMDFLIADMLPYSVVEEEAFQRLNFSDPAGPRCYKVKSEKYFWTTLMAANYEAVVVRMKSHYQNRSGLVSLLMCVLIPLIRVRCSVSLDIFCITAFGAKLFWASWYSILAIKATRYLASKLTEALSSWQLENSHGC